MRTVARRDEAEPAIIQALERIGVTVELISSPGAPDLVCYRRDTGVVLLEVKSGKRGRLTERQKAFAVPYRVVRDQAEALAIWGAR